MSITDKFNFFVPLNIEKGKDKNGASVMKIAGVASTPQLDSDQEILEPKGFELKKFLKSGFVNYNHLAGKDPNAIIGEPTKAEIKNNELHIEAKLYGDNPVAKGVYQLAQVLEKNSDSRKLGYSIEGRATERDPNNPKRITKAVITGVAVTPSPKNPGTLLEICKGDTDSYSEFEYELFKGDDDQEYVMDVKDGDTRITVDKDLVIKAVMADGGETNFEDTKKESLEGVKKNRKNNEQDSDIQEKNDKPMNKGEIYVEIFSRFTTNISKAHRVYGILEKIEKAKNPEMKNLEITEETISKAEQILGLVSEEESRGGAEEEKVEKADMPMSDGTKPPKSPEKEQKGSHDSRTKKADQGESDENGDDSEMMSAKKSETDDLDILKAMDEKFGALGILLKAQDERNENLEKSINTLTERLSKVETTKIPGRSVRTNSFLKKGEQESDSSGKRSLSQSMNKRELIDTLSTLGGLEKGEDSNPILTKAAANLEITGQMAGTEAELNSILVELGKNGIEITK